MGGKNQFLQDAHQCVCVIKQKPSGWQLQSGMMRELTQRKLTNTADQGFAFLFLESLLLNICQHTMPEREVLPGRGNVELRRRIGEWDGEPQNEQREVGTRITHLSPSYKPPSPIQALDLGFKGCWTNEGLHMFL